MTLKRLLPISTALALGCLVLSSCAGGVASQSSAGGSGEGGYAYSATQEEVDAAITDLEPVTLNFQVPAPSPKADLAQVGIKYKEAVEERSGGKITIDVIYGNAIASYPESPDALQDGRLDLAYTVTSYAPQEFPEVDAYNSTIGLLEASPQLGDMVGTAVLIEQGFSNEALLERFDERGFTTLAPIFTPAANYLVCAQPTNDLADIKGKQVRGGTAMQLELIESIGGTGVSLEFPETYEALQRNTIDCTFSGMPNAADGGVFAVAPYAAYSPNSTIAGGNGSLLGGTSISELPLAYQQILFDESAGMLTGKLMAQANGNLTAFHDIRDNNGDVIEMDQEMTDAISAQIDELVEENIADGDLPADVRERFADSEKRWTETFEGLGYADAGTVPEFGDWGERDRDFAPAGQAIFEELLLEHRPT